jgi:succinyl-CoA synthetase alpha subunit
MRREWNKMAILIDKNTRVLVQAITGRSGSLQTAIMQDAGTRIVAGVTPGKGGIDINGIPVYNFVADAKERHDFDTIISFVPPLAARDSCFEAIDAGIKLLVLTTENIPQHDVVEIIAYARNKGIVLVGPGCAGIITPGMCKVGSHPLRFFTPGHVGIVSKSGALSYEIGKALTDAGIGQSTVVAIGGGPMWGFTQRDAVQLFNEDPDTHVIVLLGEIGGSLEEHAAVYIAEHGKKPVIALIVGRCAPEGKPLGHAGAIVQGGTGTVKSKTAALSKAGAAVVYDPARLVEAVRKVL